MNSRTLGLLALSFALAPVSVLAQTDANPPGPPPPPGAMPPPIHSDRDFSKMRQMHDQLVKIHDQERSAVLGALTPEHRQLVANVIGQLGVSANPDHRAAAARIDAALTPSEKNAILSAHQTAMTQMHSAMQQMHSQMAPPGGGPPSQMIEQHESNHPRATAGDIVLRVSGGGHDMMFMRMHH